MPITQSNDSLVITWKFTLSRGGFTAKYGTAKGKFYKQLIFSTAPRSHNPTPKEIHKYQYDLAHRTYQKERSRYV